MGPDQPVTLYWIRNNRDGSDNAAIEAVSLDASYRVERLATEGRYDLRIRNTTYNRDNGSFKCMLKEGGTGRTLYTRTVGLTVLLKPSPPRITPSSPAATEGRPTNLTCSSTGGSPPPQVRWYREGAAQLLESVMVLGATRDEPSASVLTLVPQRASDGAVYRCTVWNRALSQRQKLEARTSLSVNCKFSSSTLTYVELGALKSRLKCDVELNVIVRIQWAVSSPPGPNVNPAQLLDLWLQVGQLGSSSTV